MTLTSRISPHGTATAHAQGPVERVVRGLAEAWKAASVGDIKPVPNVDCSSVKRTTHADGTMVMEPPSPQHSGVFFHGFSLTPEHHAETTAALAAVAETTIHAPRLPSINPLHLSQYHRQVADEALKHYDQAAESARQRGLPPPLVMGFSMGAGAALYVAAMRDVPAVVWAPVPLDIDMPKVRSPVLVIRGGEDRIAGPYESRVMAMLENARTQYLDGGHHLGFADTNARDFVDHGAAQHRDAQRTAAITATHAFMDRFQAEAPSPAAPVSGMTRTKESPPSDAPGIRPWEVPLKR